ncbi:DUF1294 domain-containing protein [Candidatus Falkowbacteria bacterium]|nr:DUF1294 domain-containing protein [Candidatus Falkowbacteria bacterium]
MTDIKIITLSSAYLFVNLVVFVYMGIDKARAVRRSRRVPEAHFLFLAICFCALGIWLGMLAFRHKTRKAYFTLGVPLALAENISFVYLISVLI